MPPLRPRATGSRPLEDSTDFRQPSFSGRNKPPVPISDNTQGYSVRRSQNATIAMMLLVASWLFVLLLLQQDFGTVTLRTISVLLLTTEGVIGVCIFAIDRRRAWSFPFLFYLILVLFHTGLYISTAIFGELPSTYATDTWRWFTDEAAVRSAYILLIAVCCYALGYGVSALLSNRQTSSIGTHELVHKADTGARFGIVDVGGLLTVASVAAWFGLSIVNIGFTFFLESYQTFLGSTASTGGLVWAYLGISLGVPLCALGPARFMGKVGLIAFAVFGVPAFMVGLRGEVLFPLVAVLSVLGCKGRLWRFRTLLVGSLVVLTLISLVSRIRALGTASIDRLSVSASPFAAIEEMGYSIRPLVFSIGWHEIGSEPYLDGITYWAPIERQLLSLLGQPVVSASADYRLMNVEILDRIGPIGGSIIAEAHHNGGLPGVVIVLFLVGLLVGRLFRHPDAPIRVAVSGVIAVLLLMHVRNSFAPIPVWAVIGMVLIVMGVALGRVREHHRLTSSRRTQNPLVRRGAAQHIEALSAGRSE